MATFKIGDRVRIRCPDSCNNGKQATVIREAREALTECCDGKIRFLLSVRVEVDGIGARHADGSWWAYEPHELEPIRPLPSIAELLAKEGLPEWSCPLPEVVGRAA